MTIRVFFCFAKVKSNGFEVVRNIYFCLASMLSAKCQMGKWLEAMNSISRYDERVSVYPPRVDRLQKIQTQKNSLLGQLL